MKTILLVEDEKILIEVLNKELSAAGFKIIFAVDGEEGIRKAKEEKPDLIMLDLVLPNLDGFNVLSKLKKDAETLSIPVVILSNLGQEEDIERGIKLGAVDYIVKAHFTPDKIVEKIKNILK